MSFNLVVTLLCVFSDVLRLVFEKTRPNDRVIRQKAKKKVKKQML